MLTDRRWIYCFLLLVDAEGFRGYWISLFSRLGDWEVVALLQKIQLLQVESIQALQRGGAN